MIKLGEFKKHKDWIKIWSGKWSLHFDSHQGFWWTKNKSIGGKPTFTRVIYFYENGVTDCWACLKDKDNLGARMPKEKKYILHIARFLISYGKKVENFIKLHKAKNFGFKEYKKFWDIYGNYFIYHVSVKYVVDYLNQEQIKKHLPVLERARLYSEPVTRDAENYFESIATHLSLGSLYTKEMILSTTKEELEEYLQGEPLPSRTELQKRFKKSTLLVDENSWQIFTGKKTDVIKKLTPSYKKTSSITGQVAYKGYAKGTAKIILNPLKESKKFTDGDILITGMTRPEYLPIMHRAAAFVTDAGGILSHAAITAREMKKPCIVGTKIATKIFQDGDRVEVDATKGIVRKI